jgi:hypothetical protein
MLGGIYMSTLRGLICAVGIGSLGIIGAAPLTATAAEPVISTQTITVSTPIPAFSCRPYGYSFDTLATFTVEFHIIRFFEGSTLVKEIRHIDTKGTIYRSDDLSKTIPYGANLTRTLDPASNTITITGLFRYTHPDGSGMVALDAGRTVVVPPTVITDTGPTQVEWQMAVCALLAAE